MGTVKIIVHCKICKGKIRFIVDLGDYNYYEQGVWDSKTAFPYLDKEDRITIDKKICPKCQEKVKDQKYNKN